jgi:hypothetical protein
MQGSSRFRIFSASAALVGLALGCGGKSTNDGAPAIASAGKPPANNDGGRSANEGGGGARAGSAGAAKGGTAGAAGAALDLTCQASKSPDDYDSGFEICDGNAMRLHRTHLSICRSKLPRANVEPPPPFNNECTSDQDCTAKRHGICTPGGGPDGVALACQYGCMTDDECDPGSLCLCGTDIGYCTAAECSTDAECGQGSLCAAYWVKCHHQVGFACQNPADTCLDDSNCSSGSFCERSEDGLRRCVPGVCSGI